MNIKDNYFRVRAIAIQESVVLDEIGPLSKELHYRAIEAMLRGLGSPEMQALMSRFAETPEELARLVGTDGTESYSEMNTARAFIVDNAFRDFGMLEMDPGLLEILDDGVNGSRGFHTNSFKFAPTKAQKDLLSDEQRIELSDEGLTPTILMTSVAPFVVAIEEFQHLIDQINGKQVSIVLVRSISQRSPLSIVFQGGKEAVELVLSVVIPWRIKHAKAMARHAEKEKRSEFKYREVEAETKSLKDRAEAEKISSEARKLNAEAAKIELETERLRLEFQKEQFELVQEVFRRITPNLPAEDVAKHLELFSRPLEQIATSELLRTDSGQH